MDKLWYIFTICKYLQMEGGKSVSEQYRIILFAHLKDNLLRVCLCMCKYRVKGMDQIEIGYQCRPQVIFLAECK